VTYAKFWTGMSSGADVESIKINNKCNEKRANNLKYERIVKDLKLFPSNPHAKFDLCCTCKGTVNDEQLNSKRTVISNKIFEAIIKVKFA
jgi:hypothetical protein